MVDVIILGAGPVGLTAALMLARAELQVLVVDSRAEQAADTDMRLLALSRGTWQVLAPLLTQAPANAPILDVHISSAGEFGVTRIGAQDFEGEPLGITVRQGRLMQALRAAAAQQTGLEIRHAPGVSGVSQRHQEVEVAWADGHVERAALLVHAEGSAAFQSTPQSTQRAAAKAIAPSDKELVGWALTGEVALEDLPASTAIERFTRDGPLALLPAPESSGAAQWSMVWCCTQAQAQARAALPTQRLQQELQLALGNRIARVTQQSFATAPRLVPLLAHRRQEVVAHRQVWLGNAAQTLHPVAGQGFNLGVRDCLSLTRCLMEQASTAGSSHHLDQKLGQQIDVPAALIAHLRARRADRLAISTITNTLPSLFAARLAPVAFARSLGLAMLDLLPPLRREWARLLMFGVRA